eukprot:scaffold308780_cov14-Tisochrysis_lutea.AAC.1
MYHRSNRIKQQLAISMQAQQQVRSRAQACPKDKEEALLVELTNMGECLMWACNLLSTVLVSEAAGAFQIPQFV